MEEIQTIQKIKSFDPYKIDIRELSIYINDYCNKQCKHCYYIHDGKGHTDVDPQCVQWMVDNFEIRKAIIIGGEPILSPVLPKILEILKNAKVNVTVSTNCKWINWGRTVGKKTLPSGPNNMTYKDVITMLKDKVGQRPPPKSK